MSTILLVDDIQTVREQFAYDLKRKSDFEIITTENGKSALRILHEQDIDVIILDLEMPVMDGLESLRRIIEKNPKPVLMVSVLTQHGAEETFKALEYGAIDFIPKPASNLPITSGSVAGTLLRLNGLGV